MNVHTHALVLDGVFAEDGSDSVRFHPIAPPSDQDMDDLLATVERRLRRLLARRGVGDNTEGESGPDPWLEEAPVLAGIAAASVQGRVALGPRACAEVRRCGASAELAALSPSALGPCHAHRNGFDLHAAVVVPANDRGRLERTCRYALRPPVAHERIHLTNAGQVLLELRHRWSDGTTHVLFDPIEFLERLAALTPRPRINLILYYGVLGAHAAWRSRIKPSAASERPRDIAPSRAHAEADAPARAPRRRTNMLWAQLMARSFGFDVLACARCGGRFRLIALIEDPRVIRHILAHCGLPTDVPPARPPRAPPIRFERVDDDPAGDISVP